jgi:hypothetical protein
MEDEGLEDCATQEVVCVDAKMEGKDGKELIDFLQSFTITF